MRQNRESMLWFASHDTADHGLISPRQPIARREGDSCAYFFGGTGGDTDRSSRSVHLGPIHHGIRSNDCRISRPEPSCHHSHGLGRPSRILAPLLHVCRACRTTPRVTDLLPTQARPASTIQFIHAVAIQHLFVVPKRKGRRRFRHDTRIPTHRGSGSRTRLLRKPTSTHHIPWPPRRVPTTVLAASRIARSRPS